MRKNENKALFFDAWVTIKERSTKRCLKRACILVSLPTRLILFVNRLLTNDLNFLTGVGIEDPVKLVRSSFSCNSRNKS